MLTQCAQKIQEKCPKIQSIEWVCEIIARTENPNAFVDLVMPLLDENANDWNGSVSVFRELERTAPAYRESVIAAAQALLQYSPSKAGLEWIIFELREIDPKRLPKIMEKVLAAIVEPSTCFDISNVIKNARRWSFVR